MLKDLRCLMRELNEAEVVYLMRQYTVQCRDELLLSIDAIDINVVCTQSTSESFVDTVNEHLNNVSQCCVT